MAIRIDTATPGDLADIVASAAALVAADAARFDPAATNVDWAASDGSAYASALLARGVDIRALSEYLGHHDPGFTLRTYVHLMPDADDRARQAVDAAFAASDGPATAQGGAR